MDGWCFCCRSRSRSHGRGEDLNPGNTLYVTGLSTRVTERDLEDHFNKEGKVASCFLVVEPRTRISRGFAFVTMDSVEDAERCIKYLNQSVLEGRYITVERSRRKRPRTPTPGHYLGLKSTRDYGMLNILLTAIEVIVIVVDIVEARVVMIMAIVGLQDGHLTEEAVIILPMVEGQEGTGPGHHFIHRMVAQKESMLEALGEAGYDDFVSGRICEAWEALWQQ
ncbi:hypothetical protein FEM48_Zijuj08G0083400 [Ziziphus jujuba var. spinosa]|uniref:RRM domain-containing protein n=1 Tax=Ziziphus jujuba var. spinosa TaxID=714518 RepID=A0A978UY07_ZIZJJ|nr:hypothetical protein FEM48_Zijuj08G0083400 [Ziziphus jujuba var. spinosa]